jgi:hypothetical protein
MRQLYAIVSSVRDKRVLGVNRLAIFVQTLLDIIIKLKILVMVNNLVTAL